MATNTPIETKYLVADKLHTAYCDSIDSEKLADDKSYRNYIFGILLHTPNANGVELIDAFPTVIPGTDKNPDSTDAMHIVNLTLRRFGDAVAIITVDF